jgi:hypothetical protein
VKKIREHAGGELGEDGGVRNRVRTPCSRRFTGSEKAAFAARFREGAQALPVATRGAFVPSDRRLENPHRLFVVTPFGPEHGRAKRVLVKLAPEREEHPGPETSEKTFAVFVPLVHEPGFTPSVPSRFGQSVGTRSSSARALREKRGGPAPLARVAGNRERKALDPRPDDLERQRRIAHGETRPPADVPTADGRGGGPLAKELKDVQTQRRRNQTDPFEKPQLLVVALRETGLRHPIP